MTLGSAKRCFLCGCMAVGVAFQPLSAVHAESDIQPSFRLNGWSGNRLNNDDGGTLSGEIWVRARTTITPTVSVKLEAWASTDPIALRQIGGDVREAHATIDVGGVTLNIGRQLLGWGRADRINPTDMVSARDLRRLVEEEEDNRRGIGGVSASAPLVGGTLSAHWLPEFRASKLPQDLAANGLAVLRRKRVNSENDFAIRYDRFGSKIDFSVTYANIADRLPWLTVVAGPNNQPALQTRHPKIQMFGADIATTIGRYGLRAEAAAYTYNMNEVGQFSTGKTRFAGVIGVDRSFSGQWSVILQGVVRVSDRTLVTGPNSSVAERNSQIHGSWKPVIVGGFARVKKGFAADRGSAELAGAILSGGGRFGQLKMGYIVRDSVKLHLLVERYDGRENSYLGRLKRNNLIMLGVKAGF
ncbi:MAG: DUF1302 family protein [Sphingorhabdus sp.]